MARARLAAVVVAWALAAPARADFQVWNEVGASTQMAPGLRLGFDQEVRLDHGASEVDHVRPGAWVAWRAAGWLSLRLGYRYDIEPRYTKGADYADGWHEAYAAATFRHEVHRLRLSLRLRLEGERGRPWDEDGALVRSYAARQRLELEWPVGSRIAIVGSGELFLKLADPDGPRDQWRAGLGVAFDQGAHELSVRYLLEHPLTPGDEDAHVLALSYGFSR